MFSRVWVTWTLPHLNHKGSVWSQSFPCCGGAFWTHLAQSFPIFDHCWQNRVVAIKMRQKKRGWDHSVLEMENFWVWPQTTCFVFHFTVVSTLYIWLPLLLPFTTLLYTCTVGLWGVGTAWMVSPLLRNLEITAAFFGGGAPDNPVTQTDVFVWYLYLCVSFIVASATS